MDEFLKERKPQFEEIQVKFEEMKVSYLKPVLAIYGYCLYRKYFKDVSRLMQQRI